MKFEDVLEEISGIDIVTVNHEGEPSGTAPLSDYYSDELKKLESIYKDCKNELCLKCGAYRQAGLTACANCRWYE